MPFVAWLGIKESLMPTTLNSMRAYFASWRKAGDTSFTAKSCRSLSYNCQVLTARHGLSSVILNGGYQQNFPKRGSL